MVPVEGKRYWVRFMGNEFAAADVLCLAVNQEEQLAVFDFDYTHNRRAVVGFEKVVAQVCDIKSECRWWKFWK